MPPQAPKGACGGYFCLLCALRRAGAAYPAAPPKRAKCFYAGNSAPLFAEQIVAPRYVEPRGKQSLRRGKPRHRRTRSVLVLFAKRQRLPFAQGRLRESAEKEETLKVWREKGPLCKGGRESADKKETSKAWREKGPLVQRGLPRSGWGIVALAPHKGVCTMFALTYCDRVSALPTGHCPRKNMAQRIDKTPALVYTYFNGNGTRRTAANAV